MKLLCIDPVRIDEIWPHVRPLIECAYAKGGDDTAEATEAEVRAGRSLLWVVWDGEILAAATTRIMVTPRRKILRIECCGGRDLPRWVEFMEDFAAYGRSEGCDVIRVEGREGWKKMLRDFHQPFVVLERSL